MITVGADVHKKTHTFVAVDAVGVEVGQLTVPATAAGHRRAIDWARPLAGGTAIRWAIEDCRNMSALLERDLLSAGQATVRVAPHLMATARRGGRVRGKSDPIDALAVARAAQREPDLSVAVHDKLTRELRLLTDHRDQLVAQRTSQINRLRWHLHEMDPEFEIKSGALNTRIHQQRVKTWLAEHAEAGVQAQIAADLLGDITELTSRAAAIGKQIAATVAPVTVELQKIPGCAALTAARILGETVTIDRFANEDKFARYCGVAPVPVWSGNTAGRVRLTRTGNRQLNRAIYTMALTQIRTIDNPGQLYYARKRAEGKSPKEALRCLKRHILRHVYRALVADHQHRTLT